MGSQALGSPSFMHRKIMADETTKKAKKSINLKYERDKDREPVNGIFRFYEVPGGTMSFVYRKYKEDEVEAFTLTDGQVYKIPFGVAKHLNKNGWYPKYEHIPGDVSTQNVGGMYNGNAPASMRISEKTHRFGFTSLEFIDLEDLNQEDNRIVSVEFNQKGPDSI